MACSLSIVLKCGKIWGDAKQHRRSYVLTVIASFGGMIFGWDTGLIGGVLTMPSFVSTFNLPADPIAFARISGNIVSVLQGGCFFGAGASFWMSDKFGRKKALIIADIMFLIGSIMQVCSGINTHSLSLLYIGRFVGGFGVGLISAVVPTYIGETVDKDIRGRCIGTMQLFNVTGIMLSYFINYGVIRSISTSSSAQFRLPFALQMLPGMLLLGGIICQNDSPRWLVEKNRPEAAKHVLARMRAKPADDQTILHELSQITDDFCGYERISMVNQLKAAFADRKTFYRFSMAIVLMFWQQWTGTNSLNYYSPQIFRSIGVSGRSAGLLATGIYGVVKVFITALGLLFMTEQVGRKHSLIVSSIGMSFAMLYIGINQAVNPALEGSSLTGHDTFAVFCVYFFVVAYSIGWGPIPFVLASECSPNHIRSLVMASALMTQWLFNFIIAKLTPIMLTTITYGTFLLFGVCCFIMSIYALLCVPETRGIPLELVGTLFEGNIMEGALRDAFPRDSRARRYKDANETARDDEDRKQNPAIHIK